MGELMKEICISTWVALWLFGLILTYSSIEKHFVIDDEYFGDFDTKADKIHIGMIVKNVWKPGEKSWRLRSQFVTLINSILQHSQSKGLHFILLVDPESIPIINRILKRYIGLKAQIPVTYDYFDISTISGRYHEVMDSMRPYFTSKSKTAAKYRDDLFLVTPFYHRIFPASRLIMLDIDLKFKIDVKDLYEQFENFTQSQMIGVGLDLSPHYRHVLRYHRQDHPDTKVGDPGILQGVNTGVVLFDLDKMRKSETYNELVQNRDNSVSKLSEKYKFKSHLGDQCFYSLLSVDHPEMFHILNCAFNYQLDTNMFHGEFSDLFLDYHLCKETPKIFHANGGADMPLNEQEEAEQIHIRQENPN